MSLAETKKCRKCLKTYSVEFFNLRNRKMGVRRTICKLCSRSETKRHYENHKQYYKNKAKSHDEKTRKQNHDIVFQHLLMYPCVDCGESDPVVLEFDHVRGSKKFDISWGIINVTKSEKLIEEMNKCEIRCANCHKRKTTKQFKWWKQAYSTPVV